MTNTFKDYLFTTVEKDFINLQELDNEEIKLAKLGKRAEDIKLLARNKKPWDPNNTPISNKYEQRTPEFAKKVVVKKLSNLAKKINSIQDSNNADVYGAVKKLFKGKGFKILDAETDMVLQKLNM
jgi:hypothetical protein